MANNISYVKCEDCGRRLPSPNRVCDVCGGKMSRSAEESFFTPEGRIAKSAYANTAQKTPDSEYKQVYRNTRQESNKTRQINRSTGQTSTTNRQTNRSTGQTGYNSSSKKSTGTNAGNTSSAPFVDRLGDAVDILAGGDSVEFEDLKQIGKTLVGKNDPEKPYVARTGSSTYQKSYKSEDTSGLLKKLVRIVLPIIILFFIGSNIIPSIMSDIEYSPSYKAISLSDTVINNYYSIDMNDLEYKPYDSDDYDEGDFKEFESMYVYFTVKNNTESDMEITPLKDLRLQTDGVEAGDPNYINVYDDTTGESEEFTTIEEVTNLVNGHEYFFTMYYTDVSFWEELILMHNIGGGEPGLANKEEYPDINLYPGVI